MGGGASSETSPTDSSNPSDQIPLELPYADAEELGLLYGESIDTIQHLWKIFNNLDNKHIGFINIKSLQLHPIISEYLSFRSSPILKNLIIYIARSYNIDQYYKLKIEFDKQQSIKKTNEVYPNLPNIESDSMNNIDFYCFVNTYNLFHSENRLVEKIKFLYESMLLDIKPSEKLDFNNRVCNNLSLTCKDMNVDDINKKLKTLPNYNNNEISLKEFTDSIIADSNLRSQLMKPLFN